MLRSPLTRWCLALCLLGQLVLSLTSGASMCFACGPTFCNGVVHQAAPAQEPRACCDKCAKESPAPKPEAPHRCCCGEAVPMSHDHRRVEPVIHADALLSIIAPVALNDLAPLLATPAARAPRPDPRARPPLRAADGIAVTRLLI